MAITSGFAVGCIVGLTGVGGGSLMTPLLIGALRLSPAVAIDTDFAHAVPLTLVAGIGQASLGHVNWTLLGALLIGSLPGIWLGARLAHSLPERVVRAALCVSLVTAGVKVIE